MREERCICLRTKLRALDFWTLITPIKPRRGMMSNNHHTYERATRGSKIQTMGKYKLLLIQSSRNGTPRGIQNVQRGLRRNIRRQAVLHKG